MPRDDPGTGVGRAGAVALQLPEDQIMRRSLLVLSAAVLGVTGVAAPAGADTSNDSARGHVTLFSVEVDFSARANFNGTEPSGRMRYTNQNTDPNTVIEGNVTCLTVVGNVATLAGEITSVRNGTVFGEGYILTAEDSGKFSNFPDEVAITFTTAPPNPTACPPALTFSSPVREGEVVVHDG